MIALYCVLGILFILIAVMALNTWVKKPGKKEKFTTPEIDFDEQKLAEHLSGMIKFKTLTSVKEDGFDEKEFLGLHNYLKRTYPLIHKTLAREVINKYSLIYKWEGSGSDKKPILLTGHQDVVPAEENSLSEWKHEPFSGDIADGYVWGRGTLDMKGHFCQIFEGIESLINEGYAPMRDIYIALGHDEESMGAYGAAQCVKYFKEKGISFEFVLDEGGILIGGEIFGVNEKVAAVGISEKGYIDIRLTVTSKGGHASRPPKNTAVGILAEAITKLEKYQMRFVLNPATKGMLDALGGYMKFPNNVVTANLWITKPILLRALAKSNSGAAMVRSTIAPTMLKGSDTPNVLASSAEAVVNCRISPGEAMQDVVDHFKKVIKNDEVKIEVINGHEPTNASSTTSEAYKTVTETIGEIFGEFVISPYLMVGATDSRQYKEITDGIYLFHPIRSIMQDLDTIHAANERLSTQSLKEGAEFFARLVKKADG